MSAQALLYQHKEALLTCLLCTSIQWTFGPAGLLRRRTFGFCRRQQCVYSANVRVCAWSLAGSNTVLSRVNVASVLSLDMMSSFGQRWPLFCFCFSCVRCAMSSLCKCFKAKNNRAKNLIRRKASHLTVEQIFRYKTINFIPEKKSHHTSENRGMQSWTLPTTSCTCPHAT